MITLYAEAFESHHLEQGNGCPACYSDLVVLEATEGSDRMQKRRRGHPAITTLDQWKRTRAAAPGHHTLATDHHRRPRPQPQREGGGGGLDMDDDGVR
jgi:hypothetical protein